MRGERIVKEMVSFSFFHTEEASIDGPSKSIIASYHS